MEFDFQQQPGRTLHDRGLARNGEPLVSIITPYYNGGKFFEQTFNCVMNQTFPWFEWIIVDDGSTNQQDVDLLAQFAARDPRIRVLHKQNGGPSVARNFGIRTAKTDLILPLDCDDLIEPTYIEVCWWMLRKNSEAAWAYTDSVGFSGQEYLWRVRFDPQKEKKENLLTATALIRKRWLEAIGGYAESHRNFDEDWIAWLCILAHGGCPVESTGDFLFWYRRGDAGRYALVRATPETTKLNAELVQQAAEKVKDPKPPIIFPCQFKTDYDLPVLSDWSRTVFEPGQRKRLHVAFLIPWTVMGGADKFVLDLVSGLDKRDFDIGILTTEASQNSWCQRFRSVCDDVFNLPNFMAPTDFAEFVSYYIKSRSVDILFVSNTYIGAYLVPWLRQNFPALAIVDYVHMEEWYWRKGGHARTSGVMGGVLDRTYVCNSETRNVLMKHFGRTPESVETVHIGVDAARFDRGKIAAGQLYQEAKIEFGRPIVLFICRLHPQKRPYLMLQIADQVRQKVPDVAFVVVGDGDLEASLRARTEDMGLQRTVYFLGAKTDVRPYYRDAKATLVCSLKEGLSLTAYESCAMGVPVISADVGGQKDLIDDSVGALVPCLQSEEDDLNEHQYSDEEVTSYVMPLVRILTDETTWRKMSAAARARIEHGFTIRQMVDYFDTEFHRLVTDVNAIASRQKKAEALKLVQPLAGETYSIMMMSEWRELALEHARSHPRYIQIQPPETRWQWFKRKVHGGLRHLRQEGIRFTLILFAKKLKKIIT